MPPKKENTMSTWQHNTLMLALAGALAMPGTLMAADAAKDEHHPDQAAAPSAQERAQAMRQRMMEIRTTKDLDKRKQLIEAQMKDMEAMMAEGSCPMMADGKPGMGMMGGGMGMMGGKGGMGMMMGPGMMGQDGMMEKRLDALEKRLDMMQMMMKMQMERSDK